MRYLPKSDPVRQRMLREIGIENVDELFAHIPEYCRLTRALDIPTGRSEPEIIDFFRHCAALNAAGYTSFLGAGSYYHYRPSLIDNLISRGEWFTAYTPYQPEISQGTLQAVFEFQTLVCQLTAMDVANASMYDGSTAMTEAVLMAIRVTGKSDILVARSVHPHYRETLVTNTHHRGFPVTEIPFQPDGQIDGSRLEQAITSNTAAVVVQSPNFFGSIEDWKTLAHLAHSKNALLIAVITDPVSLGLLAPPAEADIVAMEIQGFGIPTSFGGPYAGVIASKERYLRSLPGRLAGEARDSEGRRGFVLTLSTREQHIRREKATSNICTNQALCALMATIFMSVYGRRGLRELAQQNLAKASYAAGEFQRQGMEVLFPAPRFHEFVVRLPRTAAGYQPRLTQHHMIGGLPLHRYYPELGETALFCVTEAVSRARIDEMVQLYSGQSQPSLNESALAGARQE